MRDMIEVLGFFARFWNCRKREIIENTRVERDRDLTLAKHLMYSGSCFTAMDQTLFCTCESVCIKCRDTAWPVVG